MQEYLSLLRANSSYRNLWLASLITQLGDWFNLLASAQLITQLTDSGIAVSYLFLARFLPLFLFSPVAGVLADRYSRRLIMILTDLLRAATVLCFLFIRSPEQVWLFYVLTILQFTLSALFTPARSAVLANVVASDELVAANALDSLTWSTMLALGAFLGGVVAAVFGSTTAFIIDALTYVVSAFFVSQIVIGDRRERVEVGSGGWLAFVDGFRYLWREPFILGLSLVKAMGSLAWGAINVLEISYANDVFAVNNGPLVRTLGFEDNGTAVLGLIWVVSGLGTGLGPLFLRRRLGDAPRQLLAGISLGFVLVIIGIAALSLSPNLPFFLSATLIRTVGSGAMWVFSAAMLQMIVPDKYRGRVFAFEFAMLTLMQSLSVLGAGYMQDVLGLEVRQVTAVASGVGIVMGLLWLSFYIYARTYIKQIHGTAPVE